MPVTYAVLLKEFATNVDWVDPERSGAPASLVAQDLGISTAQATEMARELEKAGLLLDTGWGMRKERTIGGGQHWQHMELPKAEGGQRQKPGASTVWGIPQSVADRVEAKESYESIARSAGLDGDMERNARPRFSGSNQPRKCEGCGKLTAMVQGDATTQLCRKCYDEAGLENEHEDGLHDDSPVADCPTCRRMQPNARRAAAGIEPTVKNFSVILTGLLTQYDARIRDHNIYRLGLLFGAAQEAYDHVSAYADRSDAEALQAYLGELQRKFTYESPRRGEPPEFALSPLRKLQKLIEAWIVDGKRPKYPVSKPAPEHTPNGTSYYVWALARGSSTPLAGEGPWGPYDTLESAKTYARIGATEGAHDRAVSIGGSPTASSFSIVRAYQAGTGVRLI